MSNMNEETDENDSDENAATGKPDSVVIFTQKLVAGELTEQLMRLLEFIKSEPAFKNLIIY